MFSYILYKENNVMIDNIQNDDLIYCGTRLKLTNGKTFLVITSFKDEKDDNKFHLQGVETPSGI